MQISTFLSFANLNYKRFAFAFSFSLIFQWFLKLYPSKTSTISSAYCLIIIHNLFVLKNKNKN